MCMEDEMPTGTMMNYYKVCKRKLWLDYHSVTFYSRSEDVSIGKKIQEDSYSRERKSIMVDGNIEIDTIDGSKIKEIKKSSSLEKASIFQLKYYLYYMQKKKGLENLLGILSYPRERKKEEITLNQKDIKEIEKAIKEVNKIISRESPPDKEKKDYCKNCAFYEYCWDKR